MARLKMKLQVDENLFISQKTHTHLVQHITRRLSSAKEVLDILREKYKTIDRDYACYLELDQDDEKRKKLNEDGKMVSPVKAKLPLIQSQIGDAVTYMMEVLSSNENLYAAIAPKDRQEIATAFSAVMNEHDAVFGHYGELSKMLLNAFKYNFAAIGVNWEVIPIQLVGSGLAGGVDISESEYAGNNLTAFDMYNFFFDPSVHPLSLAQEGEFFAYAETYSPFKMRKLIANNVLYYSDNDILPEGISVPAGKWYEEKPNIRERKGVKPGSQQYWDNMLMPNKPMNSKQGLSLTEYDVVTLHIWLNPSDFKLTDENRFRLCRVVLINGHRIGRIQILNNAHGMLPVGTAMPLEDHFGLDSKSFAELLTPLQDFASYQMNIHKDSNRRSLYGITFVNDNVFDIDNYDPVSGFYKYKAPPGTDVSKDIYQLFDGPNTENTLQDIQAVTDMMQKVLPTEILKQVAGLDRATQYQAAATVQGANRRNLHIAKLVNSQAFNLIKRIQAYNIMQYQDAIEVLTQEGETIQVNPAQFRETKIEFAISDGLKGLDRLSMVMSIKEVLNSILQSQQASQEIDVVSVINYWTSMLGDKTDFSQFKFKTAFDKLTPEQKQLATQLLAQAMQKQQGGQGQGQEAQPQQLPQQP